MVVGISSTGIDRDYKRRAVLWRISYIEVPNETVQEEALPVAVLPALPEPQPQPEPPKPNINTPTNTGQDRTPIIPPKKPTVVSLIDVENTQKSMLQMGNDTFELFSLQFASLRRLQDDCAAGDGQVCYGLQYDYRVQNGNNDNAVGLRLGYGLTDNLTFGLNFDRTLRRNLPDTYRRLDGNGGVGVFMRYQLPFGGYFSTGIGRDYYRVQAQRLLLPNTEFAPTTGRVNGFAWNVMFGQDFTLNNDSQLGWYLAYRHTDIKRGGYRENVPGFPVDYGATRLEDNALAVGATFSFPLTTKLSWINAVEWEQRVGGQTPEY